MKLGTRPDTFYTEQATRYFYRALVQEWHATYFPSLFMFTQTNMCINIS